DSPALSTALRTIPRSPPRRKLPPVPPGPRHAGENSPADSGCHRPAGEGFAAVAPSTGLPQTEALMDLIAFEHDRPFVLEALRNGEIDYLEYVGEGVEADLFRHLIQRQILE